MSVPTKAGHARDNFASFVCDEASLDVLRSVAVDMGWAPERCAKGGLRNAIQSLSIAASPNILLVDLSESGDPLNDINALAEVCEPGTVVIAIGQVNDVRLYRDLLGSGIQDYLLKPLSQAALRETLVQAQASFSQPKGGHDHGGVKRHVSVAVVSTRGGAGASMLATSLAWTFSADQSMPTALFDLDIHFGTGALALDLEPGRGLTDAIENPSRIDGLFIERAMIRANDNLAILSAEAPISAPLMTDGSAFVQLQEEFRSAFEVTVIDLPRNMLINFPHLLGDVNVILLVSELTLAGARDAIRILSWLKSNAPQARPVVIANKVQPGIAEISKTDYEASIERKIDFVIPYDAKSSANAAKLGQTFIAANRGTKAGGVIKDIGAAVLGHGEDAANGVEPKAAGKTSLLGKFDLKSLLQTKPKAPAGQ